MTATVGLLLAAAAAAQPPVPFPPRTFGPRERARCLECHGLPHFVHRDSLTGRIRDRGVPALAFARSAHGALDCTQCHPDVRAFPHRFGDRLRPPVGCDADCHAADSTGKPLTHRTQVDDFRASAHREGLDRRDPDSPTCLDCHGGGDAHAIGRAKGVLSRRARVALCGECHEDRARMIRAKVEPGAVASYRRSFHFKALRLGHAGTAICQDCHAVHRVISPDSLASTVHAANRARTCGQKDCHREPGVRFAMSGANHLDLRIGREPLLWAFQALFRVAGAGVVALLAAGAALDLWRRRGLGGALARARTRVRERARARSSARGAVAD